MPLAKPLNLQGMPDDSPCAMVNLVTLIAWVLLAQAGESSTQGLVPVAVPSPLNPALQELRRREEATPPQDLTQRTQLAEWAITQGLLDEADTIFRQVLASQPSDDGAYQALAALAASRSLQNDSPARKLAREYLPPRFIEYQSKRFVVLTDRGADVASRQLALLERTHHQFLRFCQRLSLRPLPLQHKLVCVLFASMADFQHFGKTHDKVTDSRISGYYSPRHDWIVFYHAGGSHEVVRAQQDLKQLRSDADDLAEQASQAALDGRPEDAQQIRTAVRRTREQIDEHRRQVTQYAEQRNTATIVHEAIHQLLFHTGVQSATVQYPLWICEGLAASFETESPQLAFGPDCEYAPRRQRFEELFANNALIPLRELVTLETIPSEQSDVMYQQSYALVAWLCRHRKAQMRTYLFAMSQGTPSIKQATDHADLFQSHFGHAESLERTWLNYERTAISARQRALVPSHGQ